MKSNCTKLAALLLALLILANSLPALADEVVSCEEGRHVFAANAPSTELGHDGACALCGAALVGEHVPGWIDNGDGTHTAGCAICGYVAEGAVPEAHTADRVETTEATCTADGFTTVVCKCGATASQTLPALGHNIDEGVVTLAPTATEDGVMTYTCRRCGETATQPIPATGEPEAQPLSAGASEDDVNLPQAPLACDHVYGEWIAAEDGHARICEKCSGTEASNHTFDDSGVCTVCGYRMETECDHVWSAWTAVEGGHARACEKCSETQSDAHHFGEPVVTVPATENSEGEQLSTCEVCGYEERKTIPIITHTLPDTWTDVPDDDDSHHKFCIDDGCDYSVSEPHAYGEGVVITPATATENGVMTYTCTVCGHQKAADLPALSHTWGAWTAVAGDHENHYKYCTDEGCTLFYGEPHVWTESVVAPTCAAEGKLIRTCTVCGDQVETALEKADHTWGDWTADGDQHTRTCTVCGEKESAGHRFSDFVFDADKDVDRHYAVCADCGATVSAEHTWDDGAIVTAASPYATGLKQYACTAAGCTASKFETLAKLTPALTDRYLYFPVQITCSGKHSAASSDLAVPTLDFGEIQLNSEGYYCVQRTLTLTDSWQEYFTGLAGWSGSHRLTSPADAKLTLTAVLSPENVWTPKAVQLTFEDVADHFTVKFKSGDRVVSTVIIKSGEKLGSLPAVDDKEFLGWYYKNGTKATENDAVTGNLTLYARYSYDVPKTGNNDHQLMLVLLGVSGAMLVVMIFCAVQMIRLSKKRRR